MDNPFDDLRKQLGGKPPGSTWSPPVIIEQEIAKQYDQMVRAVLEKLKIAVYTPLRIDRGLFVPAFVVRYDGMSSIFPKWAISLQYKDSVLVYVGRLWKDHVVVELKFARDRYSSSDPTPTHFSCTRIDGKSEDSKDLTAEALVEALKKCF